MWPLKSKLFTYEKVIYSSGSNVLNHRIWNKCNVVKDGATRLPYNENDTQVREFDSFNDEAVNDNDKDAWLKRFLTYITRSGRKDGRSYEKCKNRSGTDGTDNEN
jgi:hypothetical protein